MNYGGSYGDGDGAGVFTLTNPVPHESVVIGSKPIEPYMKYTLKQKIIFVLLPIGAVFLFVFILPITIIYFVYRLGIRKTIRFFKRANREYYRKKGRNR